MSDMVLCLSFSCPSRLDCFRSQYKPSPLHQAYSDFYVPGNECAEFMPLDETELPMWMVLDD
jgi:hypothetical protein